MNTTHAYTIKLYISNRHSLYIAEDIFKHNRLNFGALVKSIIGNFNSIIASSIQDNALL